MAVVKYERKKPFVLNEAEREHLLNVAEFSAPASPLEDSDLFRLKVAAIARQARKKSGLSQAAFATCYHLTLGRVRDAEQGRSKQPDFALASLLALIADDPERAKTVVGRWMSDTALERVEA